MNEGSENNPHRLPALEEHRGPWLARPLQIKIVPISLEAHESFQLPIIAMTPLSAAA